MTVDDGQPEHSGIEALGRLEVDHLKEVVEQLLLGGLVFDDRVDKLKGKYLAFADGDDVGEISDRFRVKERCRAAHDD